MATGYIGIDIGLSGAIFYQNIDGEYKKFQMPTIKNEIDIKFLKDIIDNLANYHKNKYDKVPLIVYEKLGVIYGSSKQTAFSMGYQSGVIEMLAVSNGTPYLKIPAKQWQKEMFIGETEKFKQKGGRDTKAMALSVCKKLFPGVELTFSSRASKPHDGLVDAILISEYAKRKNL